MKKNLVLIIVLAFITFSIKAQKIQSPSQFLGYELGTAFTRNYKVVDYFKYISANSSKVIVKKYGITNENRPLIISYISSEENIKNLDKIRTDNLKRTGILNGEPTTNIGIVWLSYNVHGNEASATEAAMLTLYKLVTTSTNWLNNTVVIIDPSVNPDGRDRYVNWYNQTKSTPYNSNPNVTEHQEPWPSGRPNHYLFDLNRDWAWATQVETQQRLKVYNNWMPHVHVDFHEQGYNSPYYFPPAAEPFHEIITNWQRDFQIEIGKNHAKYFDKEGWRYFTKESFDLFYPSYGDTYPTYMGAIGMTYEQAGHGKAGLGIITENGQELTLFDRIAHHTTAGLSTVEVASKNAKKLTSEFKNYFNNSSIKTKNYILKANLNKLEPLFKLLTKHEITYFTTESTKVKAYDYQLEKNRSIEIFSNDIIIPTNQPKGKMVKVLFEPEAKLVDSVTYDITAWSLPYAYGIDCYSTEVELNKVSILSINKNIKNNLNSKATAYIKTWNTTKDALFLGNLLKNGFNVRFSNSKFSLNGKNYDQGTLIINRSENIRIDNFDKELLKIANNSNAKLTAALTGFVDKGNDFGSSNYQLIKPKKVAVIGGKSTSSLSFGEIWHYFETQLKYPLNVLNSNNLAYSNLSSYNVLILPNGFRANEKQFKLITEFAKNGGTLISIGSSLSNFADKKEFSLKLKKKEIKKEVTPTYNEQYRTQIEHMITGSIFNSTIDNTHPLGFGYSNNYNSLKLSSKSYQLLENGINIGYFSENTRNISGFAGSEALKNIPNSLLFGSEYIGNGNVIYMVDNPLFRSFWENGKMFFANAIFLN
ncbi:Zinc carboxypeptidase [Lutibacter oricola]|uniref:Zinc carboxypeptidase n=1 Tax=Lutibacter oricola TaxID=762486 RepID=A0A1H3AL64_9FLAO|nr:M14 family metallopeptidase [Lutibacter oricola]SDX30427.1 Zinc carboxypeptidase [Lutibacter oricola]